MRRVVSRLIPGCRVRIGAERNDQEEAPENKTEIMGDRFFIAHIFFLVALVFLLCAMVTVAVRQGREPKPMVLALLPLGLIFLTAYLGKNAPQWHQVNNIVYDGLLIYNAYYFFKSGQRLTFWFYLLAIAGTALDFAMHFVIRDLPG